MGRTVWVTHISSVCPVGRRDGAAGRDRARPGGMCWAGTGVRGVARMLSPAAEGWWHPPRRDGMQLCQHIHILVSFNPRSNCSLVDVRYLWGPGGEAVCDSHPHVDGGARVRGAAAQAGEGGSKHRSPTRGRREHQDTAGEGTGRGLVHAPYAFRGSITSGSLRLTCLRASGDLVCLTRLWTFLQFGK